MATEEGVPSAHEISEAFIEQYFHILKQMPHEARRLYVDGSVVSRPGPDGTMMSFSSVEAIDEQFLSRDYQSTTFEVLSIDSQSSLDDAIFIMVVGFLTGKDNLKRKFSQTFYLARQNSVYVVLNDIFRYVDEETSTPITPPVVESVPETEIAKPAEEVNKIEVKSSVDAVEEEKAQEVANVSPPLDNGNVKVSDEEVVTPQKPTEPVTETVSPKVDGAKRSFASIVQSMAKNAAPFQAKSPVQKPKYTGQPRAAAAPQAHASNSNSEKKNDQKIVDEPGTSIFVANLPINAMPPQLHELFKDFGPIKENGIQIRSTRASGICFGFVAFESATSVQSVLQAAANNPFFLADRKLRVKEKQVDYDGSKPSGKTGGGNRAQNGSGEGGDEFRRNRNRRNGGRNERRGDRNANQKSNEGGGGGAPEVQA